MKTKALIVDDNAQMCGLIRTILESAGMEACALTNPGQAETRLQKEKFDLVFLDLHMPAPDGIQLARQIRSSGFNQKTPIVMITGDEAPSSLQQAFQAGATFFLFKPIEMSRLMRVIRASEGTVQQERRRYQRIEVRCNVKVTKGHEKIAGTTLDLSCGGLLMKAERVFPEGDRIEVSLRFWENIPPVRVAGRVARIFEDGCMGIEFLVLEAAARERIQDFLLPLVLNESCRVEPKTRRQAAGGVGQLMPLRR